MAIAPGTNKLTIHRRHSLHCTRYLSKEKPDTYKPRTKSEELADTCQCPIWARGYLAKEKGRVRTSLATTKWDEAEKEVGRLYERGSVETIAPVVKAEPGRVTVAKAVSSFLAKKDPEGGSMDPIVKDTYAHYEMLLNDRLIPFCIPHVLGKSDTCDSFRLKTSCFELKPADRIQ